MRLASALNVLLPYLAGSSASLLENTIVEKEQLASAVYYSTEYRPDNLIQFTLSNVETEKLSTVETRFLEVLSEASNSELDMVYLRECIERQRRQLKFSAESSGTFFTDSIISDFLFGKRDGSTLKQLESLREYEELEKWTEAQWKEFLKKWISEAHHVTILGKPSANLSAQLEADEKNRIAAQKAQLGPSGLKDLEQKLEQAKSENDKEIPRTLLEKFKIPDTSSIHFIDTTTARSGLAKEAGLLDNLPQKKIDEDTSNNPLFIHFEHVPSNFANVILLLGTESIPLSLRPLLPLYLENFFNTPVIRNGEKIEFEKIVMELERDTVGYGVESASSLSNHEMLRIHFQVEVGKYGIAIQWLRELLWNGAFDETVSLC